MPKTELLFNLPDHKASGQHPWHHSMIPSGYRLSNYLLLYSLFYNGILHFGATALCEGWSVKKLVLAVLRNLVIVDYLIFEFIYN